MSNIGGVGQSYTSLGNVSVRLEGVTRAAEDGSAVPSVNVPTAAEATSALERKARVIGADGVLKASSDYRRAAIAQGLQVRVEVQAWGVAIKRD